MPTAGPARRFDLLFREAKAEPQALAEQIDLLGGMLQDNRKQQRAVEELCACMAVNWSCASS
jgi:hypothetical protein